ncbi:MAG: insulinase family protein, partial [Candidatus Latescibacteria bacterium]|nr:insulinase family protein [Candidatus Latescibacterota bacterium]
MYLRLKFPREKFDLAVEIDRGRFYNTSINEKVVEHEKKIILIERSRRVASTPRRFSNYFFGLIYGKKNFDGLGTEAFIKQLTSDDLKDYYENFLRRQKRLIVVIGDVDVDHVLTKLDEAYGNEQISSGLPVKTYSSQIPNREVLGRKLKRTSKGLSVTRFRKGW